MRMSFSRLAALFVALAAGVTLASCASSSAPIAASGPNQQTVSFPAAIVRFVQGSPNLNLGITTVDLYVDGHFAGTFGYGSVSTDFLTLPPGAHDFKLVQAGTLFPVFLEQVLTLKSATKYAVVAAGDAGYHTTQFMLFIEPHYNTPIGIRATSTFNASPNAGTIDFWYNCPNPNGPCTSLGFSGTKLASGLIVGSSAAPPASWANIVLLKASPTGMYCFGAYPVGSGVIIPYINAAAGPPNATWPQASTDDPQNAACATSVTIGPGTDNNYYVIDAPSTPPRIPVHGPSNVASIADQNG